MISKDNFQLIVVGTGSYVCGKKDDEYGTILPAIFMYAKKFNLRITITFACNSLKGKENAEKKVHSLIKLVDIREILDFEYVICDGNPEIFFSRLRNSYLNLLSIVSIPDQFHFKWISSMLKRTQDNDARSSSCVCEFGNEVRSSFKCVRVRIAFFGKKIRKERK